jgi:hypothetical protein
MCEMLPSQNAISGSTVVEHSPHHLKVEGLSLAIAACTWSEKSVKRFHLKMASSGLVALW